MGYNDYRNVCDSSGYGMNHSRSSGYTSPRREFKTFFILGYIFGIINIFIAIGLGTKCSDREISDARLRGLLRGIGSNIALFVLFVLTALLLRLPVFYDYIEFIILPLVIFFFVLWSERVGRIQTITCY